MKDKEHKNFQNELIEFLYGELSPEKEKELKAHLEECVLFLLGSFLLFSAFPGS